MDQAVDLTNQTLPPLVDGQVVTVSNVELASKKTRPPSRYTEATLLADMEGAAKYVEDTKLAKALKHGTATGIGTAATRADTLEGLKSDKYLKVQGGHLVATAKGRELIAYLEQYYPDLTDVATTARWETLLEYVAQNGHKEQFLGMIKREVEQLVSKLKQAKPMSGLAASTRKESSRMSDQAAPRRQGPTEKQIAFARKIAERLGQPLPEEVLTSFDACKAYLDKHAKAVTAPTDAQLNFAKKIAERKGITIPDDVRADGRKLSNWIDENK